MAKHYILLDHTADLKIRVTGSDLADLFKNAGLALFDLVVDSQTDAIDETIALSVIGEDRSDLMVNYLRELLYLWTGREKVVRMIDVQAVSETAVNARVKTSCYLPEHHALAHEIKAVTYHQIAVEQTSAGWHATIVLDI